MDELPEHRHHLANEQRPWRRIFLIVDPLFDFCIHHDMHWLAQSHIDFIYANHLLPNHKKSPIVFHARSLKNRWKLRRGESIFHSSRGQIELKKTPDMCGGEHSIKFRDI